MPKFKRLKLFVNLSELDQNNLIYEEVWIYKLQTEDSSNVGRYRIRYHRSNNPMIFSTEDDFDISETEGIQQAMDAYGPAIICGLETWDNNKWNKCLDWIGDPSTDHVLACQDLNDQFKSFLTGIPITQPFVSGYPSTPKSGNKPKKKDPIKASEPEPGIDSPFGTSSDSDFDWI